MPVSDQVAAEGTNTTGFVSPSGVKAYVNGQQATQGEAEASTSNEKLMTPLRTKQAVATQVPPLITSATNGLLGGVFATYNTLQKLYTYITNSFYNAHQSDARYDKKTDTISGTRLQHIDASKITSGRFLQERLPLTDFQFRGYPLTNWTGNNSGSERSGPTSQGNFNLIVTYPWKLKDMQFELLSSNGSNVGEGAYFHYKLFIAQDTASTRTVHTYKTGDWLKMPNKNNAFFGNHTDLITYDSNVSPLLVFNNIFGANGYNITYPSLGRHLHIFVIDQNPSYNENNIAKLKITLKGVYDTVLHSNLTKNVEITLDKGVHITE